MAIECAASAVGADQPHQEDGGVEDRHLEDERRADRQAEPPELAEARPVRPPEAAEEVVAAEFPVERGRPARAPANITVLEKVVAMPAPTSSRRGKPSLPKIRHQAAKRVDDEADDARPERPSSGRSMRRDEGAQHDVAEEGQQRPLAARACIAPARAESAGSWPSSEQDRLGVPEDRPDRQRDRDRAPQALAHGAADVAHGVALGADLARDHRRDRGDEPDAEDHEGEIEVGAERAGGERVRRRASRASPRRSWSMRDLHEVGQDHRPGERQRGADLIPPRAPPAGPCAVEFGHARLLMRLTGGCHG